MPRTGQGADDAAHRFHFARRPAGLGEDRPKRVLGHLHPFGRVEIAGCRELRVGLLDQAFELGMGSGRLALLGRGLGKTVLLRPLIIQQDHRLGEVQGAELGIDRHRHNVTGNRNILGLQTGPLGPEKDRGPRGG